MCSTKHDEHCTYNVTMRRVRATAVAVDKQWLLLNLSVCICSLGYPGCNAHTPYCHVACPTLKHFSTLSHTLHDFRKKKLLNTKFVFWFSLQHFYEAFLILKRTERDILSKMCIGLHVKYPLFLSDFNYTWIFSTDFQKNSQISNFRKILPVGAE